MIQTIVNFFKTAWDYIINTVTGLVGMVSAFVSANQVLTDVMAYAPAVLSAAVGLTITAFIIKFILGRQEVFVIDISDTINQLWSMFTDLFYLTLQKYDEIIIFTFSDESVSLLDFCITILVLGVVLSVVLGIRYVAFSQNDLQQELNMYYDFSQLVNNTNTIILQNQQLIACFWVMISVFVCSFVLNLFRSVKK